MSDGEEETGCVFVFYNLSPTNPQSWTYNNMPKKWWFVGGGSVHPIGVVPTFKYLREEQFSGPHETQLEMRSYLIDYFKSLKKRNIVKIFKTELSFRP